MLKTARDKRTCVKYSAQDDKGHVRCDKCILAISKSQAMCKANAHYNRKTREWEFDDIEEGKPNE